MEINIITQENYDNHGGDGELCRASLQLMKVRDFTISPGLSAGYWNNMRYLGFARDSMTVLFEYLIDSIKVLKKKDKTILKIPQTIQSALLGLIHGITAYNHVFPSGAFDAQLNQLKSFDIPFVNTICQKIQSTLDNHSKSLKPYIDDIVMAQEYDILNQSIPLFSLIKLLRTISLNPSIFQSTIQGFRQAFEGTQSIEETLILLHLAKLFLTLFPHQSGIEMKGHLDNCLTSCLAMPSPVSNIAFNLAKSINLEHDYPGAAYYNAIYDFLSDNPAFDDIPLLFDQNCTYFTTFLYSKNLHFNSIPFCLLKFFIFYVRSKLHYTRSISMDKVISLVKSLTFSDDGIRYLCKKLHTPLPEGILSIDESHLTHHKRSSHSKSRSSVSLSDFQLPSLDSELNADAADVLSDSSDGFCSKEDSLFSLQHTHHDPKFTKVTQSLGSIDSLTLPVNQPSPSPLDINEEKATEESQLEENSAITSDEPKDKQHNSKHKEKKHEKRADDLPEDNSDPSSIDLFPPTFSFQPIRLSLTFSISSSLLTVLPTNQEKQIFTTPLPTIIDTQLVNKVRQRLTELGDSASQVVQPILIAGDDFLISNVMSTVYALPDLSRIDFRWFLFPVDPKSINVIAGYLARIDPIYRNFVWKVFDTASQIAPCAQEDSPGYMPSIVVQEKSSNPLFGDPSPHSLLQFSLNHYLLFGRSTIAVRVWEAELTLEPSGTKVHVPFITSLHIGDSFAKSVIREPPPSFNNKGLYSIKVTEPTTGTFSQERLKLKGFSVWNVEEEMNVRPSDPWVMVEWTEENFQLKPGEKREIYADKITSKVGRELSLQAEEGSPGFQVLIDHRKYGEEKALIRKLKITKFMSPLQPNEQLVMRMASFTDTI